MNIIIRSIEKNDRPQWAILWQGYCDFYQTEIANDVTEHTWQNFLNSNVDMNGFVAVDEKNNLMGFVHFITHDSTWRKNKVCYLEDLFVVKNARRYGIGKKLIIALADEAKINGWEGVYWHTHHDNYKSRSLYDKIAGTSDFTHYSIDFD